MPGRTVLFGATGYTGRLVAEAMLERGMRPVLAARGREGLEALAAELGGGLETAVADVSDPTSVRSLVERGDVLVTTVGPFARWGGPAAAAASTAGAHYLDSTGEPAFIREVFERYGAAAARTGCGMLTAFGYDWVPGNLAASTALRRAGEDAIRVDVGYFITGRATPSGGTRASLVGSVASPAFAYRDGRVQTERSAKRVRGFQVGSKRREGISVGSSEHFALPRIAPQLREVNVYLGWFGPLSRPMQAMSLGAGLPGARRLLELAGEKLVKGSTGGPDVAARAKVGSHVVAVASDGAGRELAEVHVTGVDGYTFTGRVLAWGAERAADGGLQGTGALGPVDAFGLVALTDGCRWAGLEDEQGPAGTPSAARPEHATLE
ncbi:MAG: saccharopine dehydrogenase family protein [Thermoleophilaceae bacterium]